MKYLIDVSSVITVWHTYYSPSMVPEFWHWFEYQIKKGICKMPLAIFEELQSSDPLFKEWCSRNKKELLINQEVNTELVQRVLYEGYGLTFTGIELQQIRGDPFLIATALIDPTNHCVVTEEVSRPKAMGRNRKIPDICMNFHIKCINMVRLAKDLNFKTSWQDDLPHSDSMYHSETISSSPTLFNGDT